MRACVTAVVAAGWLFASSARAETVCQKTASDGSSFATCFDPGNRLELSAGSSGLGAGVRWRYFAKVDDELHWRIEHQFASFLVNGDAFAGVLYAGRYVRHSRDGHIVIPLGTPKKVFLPFDIGVEAEVGRLSGPFAQNDVELGIVRMALMFDLSRSADFRRRLAVGAVARWDASGERDEVRISEHRVAPLSIGLVDVYLEDRPGLTLANLRVEAGTSWSTVGAWQENVIAQASLERVLIAINDRPLSVFVDGSYNLGDKEFKAAAGIRFALITGSR